MSERRGLKAALRALLVGAGALRLIRQHVVLGFHRVTRGAPSYLDRRVGCISAPEFEKVLDTFLDAGFRGCALSELLAGHAPPRSLAVTFDDGFRDVLDVAAPLLAKRNLPFSVFLITATLGSKRLLWQHRLYTALGLLGERGVLDPFRVATDFAQAPNSLEAIAAGYWSRLDPAEDEEAVAGSLYLEREELDDLRALGGEICNHGHEHLVYRDLPDETLLADLDRSIEVLAAVPGALPRVFAIPHGRFDQHVLELLGSRGIDAVMAGPPGALALPRSGPLVPRVWAAGDASTTSYHAVRVCA